MTLEEIAAAEDLTASVTAFSEHARWTGVRSEDRAAWLDLRQQLLTASDVAAILGEDEHRTALDVYVDKITPRPANETLTIEDPRWWGNVLEQPVLRAVSAYYGWEYRQGGALLVSRAHPWLGATLDAEIRRPGESVWLDLEGKTTRIPRDWSEEEGRLPTRVLIQVQSQLAVIGGDTALVFALLQGSRPCLIEVQAHPEFQAIIAEEGERFMDQVRRLEPPAPSAKSDKAIRRLYPKDDGSCITLPGEAVELTRELKAVERQIKELGARKDELRNMLKVSVGSATYGELPEEIEGTRFWKYAVEERAAYTVTVEASSSRVLRPVKHGPGGAKAVRKVTTFSEPVADEATVARFRGRRQSRR